MFGRWWLGCLLGRRPGDVLLCVGGALAAPWRLGKTEKPCARIVSRWGGSSAGRASRSQCEGRGFDPLPLHHEYQRVTGDLPVTLFCFLAPCNRHVTGFDPSKTISIHTPYRTEESRGWRVNPVDTSIEVIGNPEGPGPPLLIISCGIAPVSHPVVQKRKVGADTLRPTAVLDFTKKCQMPLCFLVGAFSDFLIPLLLLSSPDCRLAKFLSPLCSFSNVR